jgi:hypothetical protein
MTTLGAPTTAAIFQPDAGMLPSPSRTAVLRQLTLHALIYFVDF